MNMRVNDTFVNRLLHISAITRKLIYKATNKNFCECLSPSLSLSLSLSLPLSLSLFFSLPHDTLSLSLSSSLSLSHTLSLSLSLFLSLFLTLCLFKSLTLLYSLSSLSFSLSVSLTQGDYPAMQYPSRNRKQEKIGNLLWGPRTWAGVLSFVDFLHINVAGQNRTDLDLIKKVVADLDISQENKIRFNFNETIGRWDFDAATPEKKSG